VRRTRSVASKALVQGGQHCRSIAVLCPFRGADSSSSIQVLLAACTEATRVFCTIESREQLPDSLLAPEWMHFPSEYRPGLKWDGHLVFHQAVHRLAFRLSGLDDEVCNRSVGHQIDTQSSMNDFSLARV